MTNPTSEHSQHAWLPLLSDYQKYRILEIIPGALVWVTLFGAIALSFLRPLWAIYFIILFDLYWLTRVVYLLIFLLVSYRRFRRAVRVNWMQKLQTIAGWGSLYHIVFLPTAGEPEEVVEGGIKALLAAEYPKDKIIVVLALEERGGDTAHRLGDALQRRYAEFFRAFLVTFHPDGVPGEMKGKGSNIAWAGRRVQAFVDGELRVPYENLIVSSFDADTQAHPQYFSYLAFHYLQHPHPTRTSFQPVPLYNNNLWQSPALMRVAANSTTFWLMTEQIRPERLLTFSSHSMSFRALVDVGFWQNDIVTEDSRIFLQGLLRYDGDYSVTPMYIPVSMDTVLGRNLWRSLVNLYKQQRRWAYGVENFPFMAWNFSHNTLIPIRKKIRYIWNQLEGVYSWATAPLLIFLLGRLPLLVRSQELSSSVVAHNAPFVLQTLMLIAMVGLFVCAILSTTLVPPRPSYKHRANWLLVPLQWVLFPVVMIVFGSFPAIDAQTRLMLGKYLGFWVTEKHRKHQNKIG